MSQRRMQELESDIRVNKHFRNRKTMELRELVATGKKDSPEYMRGIRMRASYNRKLGNLRRQLNRFKEKGPN